MDNVKNITRIIRLNTTSYLVKLDLLDEWTETWDTVYYTVVYGDKAPVNKFLEDGIKDGLYDDIIIDKNVNPPNPDWIYDPDTNSYKPPASWVYDEELKEWLPPPI
jgi:hypothetical protein